MWAHRWFPRRRCFFFLSLLSRTDLQTQKHICWRCPTAGRQTNGQQQPTPQPIKLKWMQESKRFGRTDGCLQRGIWSSLCLHFIIYCKMLYCIVRPISFPVWGHVNTLQLRWAPIVRWPTTQTRQANQNQSTKQFYARLQIMHIVFLRSS